MDHGIGLIGTEAYPRFPGTFSMWILESNGSNVDASYSLITSFRLTDDNVNLVLLS